MIGTYTSGLAPSVVPSNPAGATPTMVSVRPLIFSVLLSTLGSAAILRRPEAVREHDDRRFADEAVVVRIEQPPERRLHLQDLEVVAGDEQPLAGHRLLVEGHVGAESWCAAMPVNTVCTFCRSRNIA